MQQWQAHSGSIWSLAFTPDGSRLVTAERGEARVFDPADGVCERRFFTHGGMYTSIAISPDGGHLALAGGVNVRLIRLDTGVTERDFPIGNRTVAPVQDVGLQSVNFRPDGRFLVVGETGSWVRIDLHDPAERQYAWLAGGSNSLYGIFAPDGHTLATPADGGRIHLWDAHSWEGRGVLSRGRYRPGSPAVHGPVYAPDSQTLAVGTANGDIHLWDVRSHTVRETLEGHARDVLQVAWHPAGHILASAGMDGTVRFWDMTTARQTACFAWEVGRVNRLAFAPDGLTAVAASHLGWVVRWDVEG